MACLSIAAVFYFPFASADFRLLRLGVVITPLIEIAASARQSEGLWVCCLAACSQPVGKQETHESRCCERADAYLCEVMTKNQDA